MSLLDVQQSQREIGRIRTGRSVQGKNGKQRPEKLERFLITSESRSVMDAVAEVYGGQVQPYRPMGGTQKGWQVLVEADEIPVAVPPGQQVINQHWELWQGGGLSRRCNGKDATTWDAEAGEQHKPCVCPADKAERSTLAGSGKACKPTTTLCVLLPDIPGIGQFRLVSHGIYAAMEMGATAQLMQAAFDHGVMLPAVLRLSQREGTRRPGQVTNQFAVPELHLLHSLRQLMELATAPAGQRPSLPPPPAPRAITAGTSSASPAVPAAVPTEDTAEADLAPDQPSGPTMNAGQVADKARATSSKAMVDALGRTAAELNLLDEYVDDGTGVLSTLRDVLSERLDAIKAAS